MFSSSSSSSSDDELYIRKQKILHPRINHFDKWDNSDFYDRFRLTKETVLYVFHQVEHLIAFPTNKGGCISAINQLLLTLRYYATGSMLIAVGDFLNVSKASASRIVQRVSNAIASLRPHHIAMPQTIQQMNSIIEDFYDIAKFPKTIGTIDCTHIRIQSPDNLLSCYLISLHLFVYFLSGGDDAEIYRNRKGYFSFNVQSVSDAQLKFQNIVARWPGSVHDQTIFNNSLLQTHLENGVFDDTMILGDSGYALRNYLLAPLLETNTEAEGIYNESHIRTRKTVERQYGVWKRRFPVLSLGMRLKLDTIQTVIVATAILHNITRDMNDPEPEYVEVEAEKENVGNEQEIPEYNAAARRQQIIRDYFGQQ